MVAASPALMFCVFCVVLRLRAGPSPRCATQLLETVIRQALVTKLPPAKVRLLGSELLFIGNRLILFLSRLEPIRRRVLCRTSALASSFGPGRTKVSDDTPGGGPRVLIVLMGFCILVLHVMLPSTGQWSTPLAGLSIGVVTELPKLMDPPVLSLGVAACVDRT